MAIANIGSLAAQIQAQIDGIPTSISGAQLITIVDNSRIRVENFTGRNVGSPTIDERYQPAILDLSKAELLSQINTFGGDFGEMRIGDMMIRKGVDSNMTVAMNYFTQSADKKLKELGRRQSFSRILGAR